MAEAQVVEEGEGGIIGYVVLFWPGCPAIWTGGDCTGGAG